MSNLNNMKKETIEKEVMGRSKMKASHKFVIALALVSILSFVGIISESFFDFDMSFYVESFLMLIIGAGLVMEGQIGRLRHIKDEGLNSKNFAHLITIIIGFIAVIAGIFSLPSIRLINPGFVAIKGIISIIAILFIIIQTWILD